MSLGRDRPHAAGGAPAPLGPCERFSEEIHLLVDRELGPAETGRVEEHLLECAHCQTLAVHLERMSSLLKAWDARTGDVEAPAVRLRHAVLARVSDQGAKRRREDRLLRVMHFATAAGVLLALGLGLWLGLQSAPQAREALPAETVARAPTPLERYEPAGLGATGFEALEPYGAQDVLAGVTPLALPDVQFEARGPAWDPAVWSVAEGDPLALLVDRFRRQEDLERRLQEPMAYWNGPSADLGDERRDQPLATLSALAFLHEKGYLRRWMRRATPTSSTVVPEDVPVLTAVDTGVRVRDMLAPLPGLDGDLRDLTGRQPAIRFHGRARPTEPGTPRAAAEGAIVHVFDGWTLPRAANAGGLRSGPLATAPHVDVLDPLVAAANDQLHFAESGRDAGTVVALVENTTRPIFIPAGQFLTGGLADRVIAHPIWLPASRSRKPYLVPCRVVQNFERGDGASAPTLQPEVAGPTLRSLLAAGAPAARVKAAARRIVAAFHRQQGNLLGDWSLYSLHAGLHRKALPSLARLPWDEMGGFVIADARGRFVGAEVVRLRGAAGAELLRRLWLSYTAEAGQRIQAGNGAAFAPSGRGLALTLAQAGTSERTFRFVTGLEQPSGATVSRLDLESAGVRLHALQVGGVPAVVSVVAGGK